METAGSIARRLSSLQCVLLEEIPNLPGSVDVLRAREDARIRAECPRSPRPRVPRPDYRAQRDVRAAIAQRLARDVALVVRRRRRRLGGDAVPGSPACDRLGDRRKGQRAVPVVRNDDVRQAVEMKHGHRPSRLAGEGVRAPRDARVFHERTRDGSDRSDDGRQLAPYAVRHETPVAHSGRVHAGGVDGQMKRGRHVLQQVLREAHVVGLLGTGSWAAPPCERAGFVRVCVCGGVRLGVRGEGGGWLGWAYLR